MFAGQTVFIVGGGPSLFGFDFEMLRGRNCIAINSGVNELPFANLLYFRDHHWFNREFEAVERFAGFVVTSSLGAWANSPERLKLIRVNTKEIPRARTSGQQCVSLALVMGAKRVVLLGFDWNREGGHYHERYPEPELRYVGGLTEGWNGYAARARRRDAIVVNATPRSAITEFELVKIGDELAASSLPTDSSEYRHEVPLLRQRPGARGLRGF